MFFFCHEVLGEKLARKNGFSQQKSCRLRFCCTKMVDHFFEGNPDRNDPRLSTRLVEMRDMRIDYATIFKTVDWCRQLARSNDVVFCDIIYKKSVSLWGERWPGRQGWRGIFLLNEELKDTQNPQKSQGAKPPGGRQWCLCESSSSIVTLTLTAAPFGLTFFWLKKWCLLRNGWYQGGVWKEMDVSENSGFSPQIIHLFIGFSIINHPFWGTPIFGNTQIGMMRDDVFSLLFQIKKNRMSWWLSKQWFGHGIVGMCFLYAKVCHRYAKWWTTTPKKVRMARRIGQIVRACQIHGSPKQFLRFSSFCSGDFTAWQDMLLTIVFFQDSTWSPNTSRINGKLKRLYRCCKMVKSVVAHGNCRWL